MKCQFAIRDLLWLSLLVASWLTWWLDGRIDGTPRTVFPAFWTPPVETLHDGVSSPVSAREMSRSVYADR